MTQTQLPEDIRKQIDREAAKSFPYDLKQTIGINRDMAIKQQGYIAGATVHALACIQKDEEIGRLTGLLNLAAQKLVAAQTALMNIRDFESHNEAWEDVVDMKLIAEKYFNTNHP